MDTKDARTEDDEALRALAGDLGYMTDSQFATLANVEESTTDAWRRRGTGPAFTRIGNRVLYAKTVVAEFLAGRTKKPRRISAREVL